MHPLTTPLRDRRIVLCVAGGIAAYKSVQLLRDFVKAGAQVQVAMSKGAQEFVRPLTFQTLSGFPVFTDIFDAEQDADIGHIRIADGAELIVVAPATANLLARLVAGHANDPVTAAILASRCPILLAPAMNVNMWEAAATRHNVATLAQRGMHFVGPAEGFLACQWTGSGRLSEPADIVEAACRLLMPQDYRGMKVVVSAGGTREALDPVRFLGNRSSGKMGYALALALARRGAQVHLISGPTECQDRSGASFVAVNTAQEMFQAVRSHSADADMLIMAAAVADYRPVSVAAEKLKKAAWGEAPTIRLARTVDILAAMALSHGSAIRIGFAAETEKVQVAAREKLRTKRCHMIVANDVSQSDRGFGSDDNAVFLVWADGSESVPLASKDSIAHSILDRALVVAASHRTAEESSKERADSND